MNRYSSPTSRDWLLLAGNLVFVLGGLLILPRQPRVAIPCLAFFGLGGVLAAVTILRKRRFSRIGPMCVTVVGGVPIRPRKDRVLAIGAALTFLGLVLLVFMPDHVVLIAIEASLCLAGVVLLLGLATGRLPVGFLRFDPFGLSFGTRAGVYTFPWQSIVLIVPGEFHDNPVLFLGLRSPEDAVAIPPMAQRKVQAQLSSNLRWVGAHGMIMTSQYGIDLPVLESAVRRYVAYPQARSELARRDLPPGVGSQFSETEA